MPTRLLVCWLAVATCAAELASEAQIAGTTSISLQTVTGASSPPSRRPHVPDCFVAPITLDQVSSQIYGGSSGSYAYNLDRKTLRMEFHTRGFIYAPKVDLSASNIFLMRANGSFDITGGEDSLCRKSHWHGQEFHDMFSWAADPSLSVFEGRVTVGDRPCDRWSLRSLDPSVAMSLCADADIPVQLTFRTAQSFNSSFNFTFGNLTAAGPMVNQSLFDVPVACIELAPPCPAAKGLGPRNVEVYVFHPGMSASDYDIADQNVADLDGDAAFICWDVMHPQQRGFVDFNYTRISRYSLLMSPAAATRTPRHQGRSVQGETGGLSAAKRR